MKTEKQIEEELKPRVPDGRRSLTPGRFILVVFLFFALLLVCSWLTALVSAPGIERRLTKTVSDALLAIDHFPKDSCKIEFSGLEGRISGTVHDRHLIEDVDRHVSNLEGIRVFRNELVFHHMDEPHLLVTIRGKQKKISAQGLLPTGNWKLALEKQLRGLSATVPETEGDLNLEEWKVNVSVEEKKDVFEPKWIDQVERLLPVILRHKRASSFQIREDTLTMSGELFSEEDNSALLQSATEAFSGTGVLVHNEFRVVQPPVPPFFRIAWQTKEGKLTIDGEVEDEDARRTFAGRLMEVIPPAEHQEGGIKVGKNTDEMPWLDDVIAALPGLVGETKEGSFYINDRKVEVTGKVASHGMRESLLQLVEQTFPDGRFDRKVDLGVYEPPRPSMMSVINLMGESVNLKGLLPSEESKKQFFEEVKKRLPAGMEIGDQVEVKSSATNPEWLPALLEILPGFVSNSVNGGLTVYEKSLAIEARVDADVKWDAMYALAEKYFPTPVYQQQLEITVVDPNNPDEDLGPLDPDSFEEEMDESSPLESSAPDNTPPTPADAP